MHKRPSTLDDRPAETNGYPLRDEALDEPAPVVPPPVVKAVPRRRRFVPGASPWPILLAVVLLLGGLGGAYAVTHKKHARHASASPPASPSPPAPTPSAPATAATVPATSVPGTAAPVKAPAATVLVPSMVGSTLPKAVATLRRGGLTAIVTHVISSRPEGTVIAQNPAGGAKETKGGKVRLDVSLQPAVVVPDVTGMQGVTAVKTLTKDHLVASLRYVPSSRPARTVVAQYPFAGKKVKRGTHVRINISSGGRGSGSAQVAVPDVTGEDEATATSDLEAAGFTVESVDSPTTDPGQDGTVIDQDPNGGTRASDPSTVTIYVGRYSGG